MFFALSLNFYPTSISILYLLLSIFLWLVRSRFIFFVRVQLYNILILINKINYNQPRKQLVPALIKYNHSWRPNLDLSSTALHHSSTKYHLSTSYTIGLDLSLFHLLTECPSMIWRSLPHFILGTSLSHLILPLFKVETMSIYIYISSICLHPSKIPFLIGQ